MAKTIFVTGATDGIGLEAVKILSAQGHNLLVHGRNQARLDACVEACKAAGAGSVEGYLADLSDLSATAAMADAVSAKHKHLDVLINNAGVLKAPNTRTADGFDLRFVVNLFAPYVLAMRLKPLFDKSSRVINLSSAAQDRVNIAALKGSGTMNDMEAYSQSKLAITAWSYNWAQTAGPNDPVVIPVNPGSLLASKMVKEGFGIDGKDLGIGAGIMVRLATEEGMEANAGVYFDNDSGQFSDHHPDVYDDGKTSALMAALEEVTAAYL